MESDGDQEIRHLVADVTEASRVPAKQRATSIKPTVQKLASKAYEHGLLPDPLNELIDLLTTPSHLDQASLNALVNNLYPAARLSPDAVLKVVGCLGNGELKPPFPIQAGLLRWLVMVYHTIDGPAILSQAYPVLFNLLETAAIRPQLCHVLALITRRKHVRPFRIQAILNLSRQTGNDPALTGLLRIYKDYYPEIIVGEAVKGKASTFKHPDLAWRERLGEIQRAHAQRATKTELRHQNGFTVDRHISHRGRGGRPSGVPGVHTSHATENSVTLEEIDNVERFVNNLEKIELPNQLAAVLADPLLQKLVLLRKDHITTQRIVRWVEAALDDVLTGTADTKTFVDTMEVLEDYVSRVKESPNVILNFLAKLFGYWNGVDAQEPILRILQYTPLLDFKELYHALFGPLGKCLPNTLPTQTLLLEMYRNILRNWTSNLQSVEAVASGTPCHAILELQVHVGNVALTLVQTNPGTATHSTALQFYEQVASTMSNPVLEPLLRIANPPRQLIYLVFFSPSLGNISRLAGILAKYKTSFDAAMARDRKAYGASDLQTYNGFLMDLCNCIWRGRAFNSSDNHALACLSSPQTSARYHRYVEDLGMDLVLPVLFGLSHSPVLSLQSMTCVLALEDEALEKNKRAISTRHGGPVTQSSLQRLARARGLRLEWNEYRQQVLVTLDRHGFGGISELMRNVIKGRQSAPRTSSQPSQSSQPSSNLV
ncbi:Mis6-domain-containing protein [Sodiomyces alkalinus F11]|uniref:Mis6-domain-containing protein n=1 Tax=Sodiomyces alkalinus (strain CBS 110278 / VKM F-3762 / F11) TaxID=1314773 RepID=A0A3N2Q9A3_SODAK|nr:Mis6-domain-containing protein [Sodiomyces alkalinus F11]ROT43228.1 Mis6-domain-containing protein [Sodiomyces alkalinus F11]